MLDSDMIKYHEKYIIKTNPIIHQKQITETKRTAYIFTIKIKKTQIIKKHKKKIIEGGCKVPE